jgi:hypothetical protein
MVSAASATPLDSTPATAAKPAQAVPLPMKEPFTFDMQISTRSLHR